MKFTGKLTVGALNNNINKAVIANMMDCKGGDVASISSGHRKRRKLSFFQFGGSRAAVKEVSSLKNPDGAVKHESLMLLDGHELLGEGFVDAKNGSMSSSKIPWCKSRRDCRTFEGHGWRGRKHKKVRRCKDHFARARASEDFYMAPMYEWLEKREFMEEVMMEERGEERDFVDGSFLTDPVAVEIEIGDFYMVVDVNAANVSTLMSNPWPYVDAMQ